MPLDPLLALCIFVILMFGVGWLAVRLLIRKGAAEYRRDAENLARISSLSVRDAATEAWPLLSESDMFQITQATSRGEVDLNIFAPELRSVLQRYELLQSTMGSRAQIGRAFITPSTLKEGFVRIGLVAEGTDVAGEISVRPADETIYELYPNESPDPVFGIYRSIYHWILAMAEERNLRDRQ